jgi:putative phosphoribosyl transferase
MGKPTRTNARFAHRIFWIEHRWRCGAGAAAELPDEVDAVVSRGGRPDLAGQALPKVKARTLLIVGGEDHIVIDLNEQARAQMRCEVKIDIVPGATHLFEEPGALEQVAQLASNWFIDHIDSTRASTSR